jgi:hypothetical protein
MANRVLSPPPHIPRPEEIFGLQTAPEVVVTSGIPSILGLNDYGPITFNRPPLEVSSFEMPVQGPAPAETAKPAFNLGESVVNPAHVETQSFESPVAGQKPDTVTPTHVIQETVTPARLNSARKMCQWCNSEAGVEDRFCKVCGAVF